ncbi:helix-turn-helix domain-containing protein [Sediminitomix flava]|uniref:helix-turn-helix domain-containing protein n=1 Tax=Sediminitomix flava TaxID=379075 RepID=UPI0011B1D1D5|nr:helix-turn-helix domain-containing protein [Sediminitomix flava]
MIKQTSYSPSFPLNQFVDTIWYANATSFEVQSKHYAPLFTELIFNYGDQFEVEGQHVDNLKTANEHLILSGLKTQPFQTKVTGKYNSVGLILKPYCYGILAHKLGTNELDELSDKLQYEFFEKEFVDFQVIEQHIMLLFKDESIDPVLNHFENYFSNHFIEKGSLATFNSSISLSQKSFIQKFKKHYLLTPTNYLKLKRVNHAIQLLENSQSSKLIEVGLDAGFYDQSHFIKLFKQFSGYTPKDFLKNQKVNSVQFL